MISVRCLGHIGTAVGSAEIQLDLAEVRVGDVVDKLRSMSAQSEPGFSQYNTLVMVGEGEAFVPAASNRIVRDGEKVVIIPFSHGG